MLLFVFMCALNIRAQTMPPPDTPNIVLGGISDMQLFFDNKIYSDGEEVEITLYLPDDFAEENQYVFISSSETGDSEVVEMAFDDDCGCYGLVSPLKVETHCGAAEGNNQILSLEPGEMFSAFYFPVEEQDTTVEQVDLVFNFALFEALSLVPQVEVANISCFFQDSLDTTPSVLRSCQVMTVK